MLRHARRPGVAHTTGDTMQGAAWHPLALASRNFPFKTQKSSGMVTKQRTCKHPPDLFRSFAHFSTFTVIQTRQLDV